MSRLILNESAAPSAPATAKVSLYADTTANPQLRFIDDGGLNQQLLDNRNTIAQVGNKDFTDSTTTISNVSLTSKAVKFSLSGMTAAVVLTISSSQSTSQTLTIPNIAGADTLATLGLANTFTGLNAILCSSSGLTIRNPANTFAYTITAAAIVGARILNLPLTTGSDTLMCLGLAQSVTGVLTLTTPNIGAATGTSVVLTGAITSSGTAGVGYATGAGGAVTQATSKVTAFTLSKTVGTIQFAADALGADTSSAGAAWTNTTITANDVVLFTHSSGGTLGGYIVSCTPAAGSATIFIRNVTPGSLSEAPIFRFVVIKGVVA